MKYDARLGQLTGSLVPTTPHRPEPYPKAMWYWDSLPSRMFFLPVCGYFGAGALVGLGVCVPGVEGPGRKRRRREPMFFLGVHDGEKKPHATSPALVNQRWCLHAHPCKLSVFFMVEHGLI